MKFLTSLMAVLLSFLLLAGCGEPSGTEHYALDSGHFATNMAKVLVDSGKIPAYAQDAAEAQLRKTVFDLYLYPDKSFSAKQRQGSQERSYKGSWSLRGKDFELRQTHMDGNPLADELTGTLENGVILVTGVDQQTKHKYQMRLERRSTPATAPR